MSAPEIAERLPEGYLLERGEHGVLALLRECAPALRAAGYGLETDGAWTASTLAGRKPLFEITTSAGVFLVRRFSHGGLLRFLTRERFRDPSRPFRELAVSASLSRAGVDTPQIAAARARAARGWGWRLEVVTRRVEGALDLDEVLALARAGEVDRQVLRRLARATGSLVRALHDAGCRHADLTTKNMLVDRAALLAAEPRMWILDLDRAQIGPGLSLEERHANLTRLYRYVFRRERIRGRGLGRTDWMRFLAGYERDRARRRSAGRAILAAYERSLGWHALGWRLERLFSGR
jgi:hypothetical protein